MFILQINVYMYVCGPTFPSFFVMNDMFACGLAGQVSLFLHCEYAHNSSEGLHNLGVQYFKRMSLISVI